MAAFSLRLAQATIAQDTTVLKHDQLRTSNNAIFAFKKVFRPFLELTYQELAIFS